MKIYFKLLLLISIFNSANAQGGQSEKLVRFHDYSLTVEGVDCLKKEDYKFELHTRRHKANNPFGFVVKSDSLQYIKTSWKKEENGLVEKKDTFHIILNEDQLNQLYEMCVNNFKIGANLTKYPIPPPPTPPIVMDAHLEFELCFRGEKYMKTIKNGGCDKSSDKEYRILSNWLISHFREIQE